MQASTAPEHIGIINRWLWDKPPVEHILAQQQDIQRQQQLKQQQQQQQAAAAALALQQQQQQQRLLAAAAAAAQQSLSQSPLTNRGLPNNSLAQQQLLAQRLKNTPFANFDKQQLNQLLRQQPNLTPQMIQAAMQLQIRQQTPPSGKPIGNPVLNSTPKQQVLKTKTNSTTKSSTPSSSSPLTMGTTMKCEICDSEVRDRYEYLTHLKQKHNQLKGKGHADMAQGPPLACSRCRDRCWTYEGLERHLVMEHGLVTSDLLSKAQNKEDGGRCKLCTKQYAFNMLQHLAWDHKIQLSAADIQYSCDVCSFKCKSYPILENHLTEVHKNK